MQGDQLDMTDRFIRCRVIDYETTGTPDQDGAEVIEMAYVDVDLTDLSIKGMWGSLARPRGPIPPEARAVHHIGPADVEGKSPAAYLWQRMWGDLEPMSFVAAHNADFERAFHTANGRRWICTYRCAQALWPDAPGHSNQTLRYWLGLDDEAGFDPARAYPPHRALPDAYVTAHILRRMLDTRSAAQLADITARPLLLGRLSFGKHKGMTYAEAPLDYLRWITRSDLNRDVKHTARHWLRERGG